MITVKVMHPDAGYEINKENIKKLQPNTHYEVYHIDMGQSHTHISLVGIEGSLIQLILNSMKIKN